MAKQIKSVVRNTQTGETIEYTSGLKPRKTEAGPAVYIRVNIRGLAWFLKTHGITLNSSKEFEDLFCNSTGMPKDGVGYLTNWRTDEEKDLWKVTVEADGRVIDWSELTKGYTRSKTSSDDDTDDEPATISVSIPQPAEIVAEVPKPISIMTDKTPTYNQEVIDKIVGYLKQKVSEPQLLEALTAKLGNEELAKAHMNKAKEVLNPKVEIGNMFSF